MLYESYCLRSYGRVIITLMAHTHCDEVPEGHRPCLDCGSLYDIHSAEQFCHCSVVCPCCGVGRAPVVAYPALSACSTECLREELRLRREAGCGAWTTLVGAQAGVSL